MDKFFSYFFDEPRRLISIGQATFTAGTLIIFLGLVGLIARTGAAFLGSGPAHGAAPSLAKLYPDFWTWWIPETVLGAVPALLVVGVGIWLTLTGRKLLRFLS